MFNYTELTAKFNRLLETIWAIINFLKEFTTGAADDVSITIVDKDGVTVTKTFSNIAKITENLGVTAGVEFDFVSTNANHITEESVLENSSITSMSTRVTGYVLGNTISVNVVSVLDLPVDGYLPSDYPVYFLLDVLGMLRIEGIDISSFTTTQEVPANIAFVYRESGDAPIVSSRCIITANEGSIAFNAGDFTYLNQERTDVIQVKVFSSFTTTFEK